MFKDISHIQLFDEFYSKIKGNTEIIDYYNDLEKNINLFNKFNANGVITTNFISLIKEAEVHKYFSGKYNKDFSDMYLDINNILANFSYLELEEKSKKILSIIEKELKEITTDNKFSGKYNNFFIENGYDDYTAGIQSYFLFIVEIIDSYYKTKLFLLEMISSGIKKGKTKGDILMDLEMLGLLILTDK